jgi:hypothetical protein
MRRRLAGADENSRKAGAKPYMMIKSLMALFSWGRCHCEPTSYDSDDKGSYDRDAEMVKTDIIKQYAYTAIHATIPACSKCLQEECRVKAGTTLVPPPCPRSRLAGPEGSL